MPHNEILDGQRPSDLAQRRTPPLRTIQWPADRQRFANRIEAGQALSAAVAKRLLPPMPERPLVLGLSRGGVVVASEIALALDADLDVVVARKVGLPWRPCWKVGAIADEGPAVFDHGALAGANAQTSSMATEVRKERQEVRRQRARYRGERPVPRIADRTVVLADDGLTPSVVARAAVRAIRAQSPATIVYAAPVCAAESADWLSTEADQIIHLESPRELHALGLWYRDATPVSDQDVTAILALTWGAATTTSEG